MKKLWLVALFISAALQAQYTVKGTLNPIEDYSWILLYKVEGAKQEYILNTKLTKNENQGTFSFDLPADTKPGTYRLTFDLQKNGYLDFLFNKENVELIFNPKEAEKSVVFSKSNENILYRKYLQNVINAQYTLDSLQIAYLKTPNTTIEKAYKTAVTNLQSIQNSFQKESEGSIAYHFIKATDRYNAPEVAKTSNLYLKNIVAHFYDKIDFNDPILYNSSFLIDRIADYVFYLNYSNDANTQLELHKKAVTNSLNKIEKVSFKGDVMEFLITQFAAIKNSNMVTYIFENHYNKLPLDIQDSKFKNDILGKMITAIGNVAPDFSWTENNKNQTLHGLKGTKPVVLIFYSTECSHCVREIPEIFKTTKDKSGIKVVAFAMETSDTTWKNYIKTLPGWYHALGLDKWTNKTARTYQINSTPTYFVLDTEMKIVANPEKIEDLNQILNQFN